MGLKTSRWRAEHHRLCAQGKPVTGVHFPTLADAVRHSFFYVKMKGPEFLLCGSERSAWCPAFYS